MAKKPPAEVTRAKAEEALTQLLTSERRSKTWQDFISDQLRRAGGSTRRPIAQPTRTPHPRG